MDLRSYIRDVPDFPQPGVVFKDITPLLQDPAAFEHCIAKLEGHCRGLHVGDIVAIEARGFILGAPLALRLGAGFVPLRKKGKLPRKTVSVEYGLEYGSAEVELHEDAVRPGKRVFIVDDVLATGGTAAAAINLVERLGAQVVGIGFLLELGFLNGRDKLPNQVDVFSVVEY